MVQERLPAVAIEMQSPREDLLSPPRVSRYSSILLRGLSNSMCNQPVIKTRFCAVQRPVKTINLVDGSQDSLTKSLEVELVRSNCCAAAKVITTFKSISARSTGKALPSPAATNPVFKYLKCSK